jgi:hypothetical protein
MSKAAGCRRFVLSRIARVLVAAAIFFYAFVTLSLLLFRPVNLLTTAVQVERRLELVKNLFLTTSRSFIRKPSSSRLFRPPNSCSQKSAFLSCI